MYTEIKTFDDACKAVGTTEVDFNAAIDALPETIREIHRKYGKVDIIAQAINEGWKPDWKDLEERKYQPVFDMEDNASLVYVNSRYGYSNVGSRLCFQTREKAEYAVNQFTTEFQNYLNN